MTDEQIIYLSPEEELTNVRERLEHAQAQRIILIVPTQTQLRSHMGWRLLHSRARELGKDVLVISSDRQIRSVVKTVGFRVADSQESPPSGGSRPGSRPSRTGQGGKTGSRLRPPLSKSGAADRGSSTDLRIRQREQPTRRRPVQEPESQTGNTSRDEVTHPISPTFGIQGKNNLSEQDSHIETVPPIGPLEQEHDFDEADPLMEDYQRAQSIRQAAQSATPEFPDWLTADAPDFTNAITRPNESWTPAEPSPHELASDPFALMEDSHAAPLPEQRGATSIDELDEAIPDIADFPTDEIPNGEVEDLGDEGDIVIPGSPVPRTWAPDVEPEKPGVLEEAEPAESSRVYGVRSRNNRQGNLSQDVEGEEVLAPMPVQPPLHPLATPTPVGGPRAPIRGAPTGPISQRNVRRPVPAAHRPGAIKPAFLAFLVSSMKRPAPVTTRSASGAQSARRPGARRNSHALAAVKGPPIILLAAILLLVLLAVLAYFVPSADVTVIVPSQSFSTPLALTATANSQQNVVQHTVPAKTLVFDMSATMSGHVTGTKKVPSGAATGIVNFTNKGTLPIHIPVGIIVSTSTGVQFATTADALVLTADNQAGNTVPIPVQAQSLSQSGNIAANSITSISGTSLDSLKAANGGNAPSLSVTNPNPINIGAVHDVPAVTANDISLLKKVLDPQLQQQAKGWLAQQMQIGDVLGKPIQTETSVATPAQDQVAPDGMLTEHLSLHMTVLVVRAADLQTAAQSEFNAAAHQSKANYALVPQQTVSLKMTPSKTCTPMLGDTSLTLCYTATGQIAPQVPSQGVREALAGKTVQEAPNVLMQNVPGSTGTLISVSPGFFPWLPFWSQHINLHTKYVP